MELGLLVIAFVGVLAIGAILAYARRDLKQ
jgi:hypothetical protein